MTKSWKVIGAAWAPIAVACTAIIAGIYVMGQQVYRTSANDPQTQMSAATAANIDLGSDPRSLVGPRNNDLATTAQTFTIITDAFGTVLATDAVLDGIERVPPIGALHYAAQHGVHTITWQPKVGVRLATVIRANNARNSYIIVGRSLAETEERIRNLGKIAWCVWLATLFATLVVAWLVSPSHDPLPKLATKRRKTN